MKALKIIGIILAVLVVAVIIGSFVAPTTMHVERSVEINAPRALVHQYVSHFSHVNEWSPWAKMDPNMKSEIVGKDGTVGAIQKWEGNDKVGKGEQEFTLITEDSVNSQVRFKEPFESTAEGFMVLEETSPTTTKVTWGFNSTMSRPFNVMGLFMDMEAAIGADYQKGLDSLKAIAEGVAANKTYRGYKIEEVTFPETHFAYVKHTVKWTAMDTFYSNNLPKIYETLGKTGKTPGLVSGLYYTWDETNQQTEMAAAVAYSPVGEVAGYQVTTLSGKAVKIAYHGAYDNLGEAHNAIDDYLKEQNLSAKFPVIEQYVTDPKTEADTSKWLTEIYYLID